MAAMDWRSEKLWTRAGYAVTVLWIFGILLATDGDMADPLFDLIFIVPLGMWIAGVFIARMIRRRD
jgi:type IV secretory pathway TrbD component